ncbi:hypothetical protein B0T36_17685 [Nocardia donostiensis]|nr:hypothetical protein B0T36_17685 [Nocardia donostiensis]
MVDRDGAVEVDADESASARAASEQLVRAIPGMHRDVRPAAIATDVRLPEIGGDGISVFLEHAEGVALSVLEAYRLDAGEVVPGTLEAHSERRQICS